MLTSKCPHPRDHQTQANVTFSHYPTYGSDCIILTPLPHHKMSDDWSRGMTVWMYYLARKASKTCNNQPSDHFGQRIVETKHHLNQALNWIRAVRSTSTAATVCRHLSYYPTQDQPRFCDDKWESHQFNNHQSIWTISTLITSLHPLWQPLFLK